MTGIVVRELQKLGVKTSYFLADWHTWINNKLGGDRDFIKTAANEYFGPAMQIGAKIAGAEEDVQTVLGSDLYHNNDTYWASVIEISKNLTLARVVRSTSIMGRSEEDNMPFGYLIYPPMQAADIFGLNVDIAHAGMDQRKVHVIARDVALKLDSNKLRDAEGTKQKPIIVHHHLLMGLQKPQIWPVPEDVGKEAAVAQMKMSKSLSGSAVFIHDSPEEIRSKIRKAFCPEKETEFNPVIDWVKHAIMPIFNELVVKRDERYGGSFVAKDIKDLEDRYKTGELFPLDLKNAVANAFIELLAPARQELSGSADLIKEIERRQSR